MKPALLVFGYAVVVAWCVPALLARLTAAGVSARLGLAAWLTAMASVLASLAVAMQYLVASAIAGWSQLAEAVCRSVAGGACTAVVYRSAAFELGLGLAATAAALALTVLAWRYGRSVQRAQRRTRAHAEAARITGQLAAVLAHERAHLAGRHHLLIALTRGLAATFPGVPLFTRGPAEVARLAEMCADDAAARRSGRPTLVTALLAMGTGAAVPAAALGATTCAVAARVQRLLEPAPPARHARNRLALLTAILLLALVSGLVTRYAGPLTAHGLIAG
jgi:hypothetical protein